VSFFATVVGVARKDNFVVGLAVDVVFILEMQEDMGYLASIPIYLRTVAPPVQ
jgi:hypothetical protein